MEVSREKFLSDVLSSLANPTGHRQRESEDKSENEVFVTWPWNRSVIWLCARQPVNLNTHPAKFGDHRTCGWGNTTFSNCHVTTDLKCHVTFLGPTHDEFGVHRCCKKWRYTVFYLSRDHLVNVSREFVGGVLSSQVTTLLSLGFIDLVKVKI